MKQAVKAKTSIEYHGRRGYPTLHWSSRGRAFIMVRKRGGGTKRLYLDTKTGKQAITKGYNKLLKEAKRRRR